MEEVRQVVAELERIEDYPDDHPCPSALLLDVEALIRAEMARSGHIKSQVINETLRAQPGELTT